MEDRNIRDLTPFGSSGGATKGIINDQFGNGAGSVVGGSVSWSVTRVTAYGPLPGSPTETLTDITRVAEATVWRSHRVDATGFISLGARYYEPTSGRFLSADPRGHAASMSLYDFAAGDPVNFIDPDGRLAKKRRDAEELEKYCADINKKLDLDFALVRLNLKNSQQLQESFEPYWRSVNEPPGQAESIVEALDKLFQGGDLASVLEKINKIMENPGIRRTGNVVTGITVANDVHKAFHGEGIIEHGASVSLAFIARYVPPSRPLIGGGLLLNGEVQSVHEDIAKYDVLERYNQIMESIHENTEKTQSKIDQLMKEYEAKCL